MIDELEPSSRELDEDDAAAYGTAIEPLSVPVLQAALEVERHGREWLEQTLTTRQAERDELRRELERLRDAMHGRDASNLRAPDSTSCAEQAESCNEIERLRDASRAGQAAVTALNEQLTAAVADRAGLTARVEELERERGDLRRQLTDITGQLNAVVVKRDALIREREALARAAQTLQATALREPAVNAPTPNAPAVNVSPSEASAQPTLAELGRSMERIAESTGAL